MVTKAPWLSLSVPNVKRLHWLPVKFCIHFKTSTITYRTLKDNRSVNLTELLAQPKFSKYLRFTFPYENKPRVMSILALKLLAFTTRPMVRSTHLALSPIRFTNQFDFGVSDRYIGKRKYILRNNVFLDKGSIKSKNVLIAFYWQFNPFSVGINLRRPNLTSVDVRFWRLKSISTL